MPLFSRSSEPEEEAVPVRPAEEERPKRHGLFGSKRDPSPTGSAATDSTRLTTSTYHTSPGSESGGGGFRSKRGSLLHRTFGNGNGDGADGDAQLDPSIVQARERVLSAEAAERDADRALDVARRQVREARDQVRKLELEAKEEARRAKIKQYHAREVSRRGKALGRTWSSRL